MNSCPLCQNATRLFFREEKTVKAFFKCNVCDLIHLDIKQRLAPLDEQKRYQTHNNDIHDPRYQNFVKPLYEQIKSMYPLSSTGLDYGCGEGPVLSYLLSNAGYAVKQYDPFFKNDTSVFEFTYDYIFATEVIEHIYEPNIELKKLKKLIKPNGSLAIMTEFVEPNLNFETWYYKNDPTHVCFYSENTCVWIVKNIGFKKFERTDRRLGWFKN